MPPASAKPTLATIAEQLGVSRATVSNAFNRPAKLSPALRTSILETAERLGYSGPDPTAAGLRRGRVGAVGVIVPDHLSYAFSDPAVVVMLDGLAEVLDEAGTAILLLGGGRGLRRSPASAVSGAAVDGFVLYGGVENPELAGALQRRRLPVVALGGSTGRGRVHVDIDEEVGAAAMAHHLHDLGHRRFGIVTLRSRDDGQSGPMSEERRRTIVHGAPRRRLAGTLAALAERGVAGADVPVYEVDHNDPDEGAVAAGWLLDLRPRPTAVICQSDQLAFGVLAEAAARGLRVPEQLSVGGFDDVDRAALSTPQLTTVHQELRGRGRAAGQLLLRTLAGEQPRSRVLPTRLVVRASTAPPAR
jgi:DNA-binding LacI/PurR family transcriptional regulator